jgi:hypothetical protein
MWAIRKLPVRPSDQYLETLLEEISRDLREAAFGEICDAVGVHDMGETQFARNTNITSRGLIDSPYEASWVVGRSDFVWFAAKGVSDSMPTA